MFAAVLPLLPAAWAAVAIGRGGGGPGWITFAIIGGIIAVALVAAYFSYLQEKKRAEALRQVAEELQFDFTPKGDGGLLGELTGQGLFRTRPGVQDPPLTRRRLQLRGPIEEVVGIDKWFQGQYRHGARSFSILTPFPSPDFPSA